jgi:hypothetical protein
MKRLLAAASFAAIVGWSGTANAQGWVHCATEGGFCRAPYGALIHFGLRGAFTHRRNPDGGLPCTDQVFGDPLVGVHKECFFSY